jgi:hypothetical protein
VQLFEEEKSAALAPAKVRLARVTVNALTFWIVTVCGLDTAPTAPIGKVSSEGVICSDAGVEATALIRKSRGAALREG